METAEIVVESPLVTTEQVLDFYAPFEGDYKIVIRPPEKLTKKQKATVDNYYLGKQRGLYFGWVRSIGDEFGNSVDEQHLWLKEKFLLPVLEQESEKFKQIRTQLAVVYKHGSPDEALFLRKQIASMVSVSDGKDVDRHIMWLYMDDVHKFAMSQNIRLKMPEDYRDWEA